MSSPLNDNSCNRERKNVGQIPWRSSNWICGKSGYLARDDNSEPHQMQPHATEKPTKWKAISQIVDFISLQLDTIQNAHSRREHSNWSLLGTSQISSLRQNFSVTNLIFSRILQMSMLFNVYAKQVQSYCDTKDGEQLRNCKDNMMMYGVVKLHEMNEASLDKMDPYQRGADNIRKFSELVDSMKVVVRVKLNWHVVTTIWYQQEEEWERVHWIIFEAWQKDCAIWFKSSNVHIRHLMKFYAQPDDHRPTSWFYEREKKLFNIEYACNWIDECDYFSDKKIRRICELKLRIFFCCI